MGRGYLLPVPVLPRNDFRTLIQPTPTTDMDLHEVALDIGIAVNHSTYDTLYLAFAIAMGATGVVVSDGPFVRDMRAHPDPALAAMTLAAGASPLTVRWPRVMPTPRPSKLARTGRAGFVPGAVCSTLPPAGLCGGVAGDPWLR